MNFDEMAEIHAVSFTHAPRPWNAIEFQSLLASPNTQIFTHTGGFAIIRLAGPEAELLTIAVHPDHRRQRIAVNLMEKLWNYCENHGVEEVFLEVSEKNTGAISLYENCGYLHRATRKDYYSGPNGQKVSALVMSKAT